MCRILFCPPQVESISIVDHPRGGREYEGIVSPLEPLSGSAAEIARDGTAACGLVVAAVAHENAGESEAKMDGGK